MKPRYTDDPTGARFAHVDLHYTDLRTTFARVKHERELAEAKRKAAAETPAATVRPIRRAAK